MAEKKKSSRQSSKSLGKKSRKPALRWPRPTDKKASDKTQGKNPVVRYFRGAWAEIKRVKWPTRQETIKLSFAVIVFSVTFALFTSLIDFALGEAFQQIILGS